MRVGNSHNVIYGPPGARVTLTISNKIILNTIIDALGSSKQSIDLAGNLGKEENKESFSLQEREIRSASRC